MTTKLEIIGPYTPDHEGPFCTRDGKPVRIICTDRKGAYPIVVLAQDGDIELLIASELDGVAVTMGRNYDLMNAREVPVAREFWINEYSSSNISFNWFSTFSDSSTAKRHKSDAFIRTIHAREVLPGEGE